MTAPIRSVEAARNRLLRRVDWRFLLPGPLPRRILQLGAGDLGAALVSLGASVERAAGARVPYELAVIEAPDDAALRTAHAELRGGGTLYAEWRRAPAGVAALRRRFEAAGFGSVAFLAPSPARGRTEQWLPLDAPRAVRYAITHRPGARTTPRAVARIVRDTVRCASARVRGGQPLVVIARRDTPPGAGGLEALVADRWSAWGLGEPPRRVSVALLTGGLRSINKVVALVFADRERTPRLAIKMPRVAESVPALAHEAATLRELHQRRGGVSGVPAVLFWDEHRGAPMMGQTVVGGRWLSAALTPRTARRLALEATAWQVQLAGETMPEPEPAAQWRSRLIDPVLADFDAGFGAAVDRGLLREAAAIVESLRPLPAVCEQRDFAPWNLLLTHGGRLAVLDWESSELRGVPGLDLIYFLTYLGIYLDGAHASRRYAESYRATLAPRTRTGEIARECVAIYAHATGIGMEDLRALRLLAWMLHSRSSYRQMTREAGGGRPDAERLRSALFIRLWEAELRHGGAG